MSKLGHNIFIAFVSLIVTMTAVAEETNEFVPKSPTEGLSPNARSFQRYGEIPVSLYTGTPNITIPLVTLREGHLTLPIDLSYHSGGIKVDDHPGWTGLGWTLTAGGAITREVRDIPDEKKKYGYRESYSSHHLDQMTSSTNLQSYVEPTSTAYIYDTEPDKFNFSFPGYSGFFMMDSNGEWQVQCDRPIKVTCGPLTSLSTQFPNGTKISPLNPPTFRNFTLTADDGTEYVFGNGAIDLSISCHSQATDYWWPGVWYLVEIRHPNGDKITLGYERGDFVVNFVNSNYFVTSNSSYMVPPSDHTGGDLISPVYLASIRGASFSASFHRSESTELDYTGDEYRNRRPEMTGSAGGTIYWPKSNSLQDEIKWSQLDYLSVWDHNSVQVRKIEFYYSSDPKQRLTLNKIGIANREATPTDWYSFSYNNINHLPKYLSTDVDHWGFYGCKSTVPTSGDYRDSGTSYTGYGVLTGIQYPTGGFTRLEYEPHKYGFIAIQNESVDGEKIAGGVRIKRIINQPEDGALPEVKTYTYTPGILEGKPIYSRNFDIYDLRFTECSTMSLGSLTNNFGNHISYPTVMEESPDGSYVVHTFTSPTVIGYRDEAPMQSNDFLPFVIHSLKGHYRGLPLSSSYYSNTGTLVKTINHEYSPLNDEERWVVGLYKSLSMVSSTNQHGASLIYYKYSLYRNYYHQMVETKRTETTWAPTGRKSLVKTFYHSYNDIGQIKSDSTVTLRMGQPQTDVAIRSYAWEKNAGFKSSHFMSQISDVINRHNGKTLSHIAIDYTLSSGAPAVASVADRFDGSDSKLLYTCSCYNAQGFPVEVTDASGLTTVYLWSVHTLYPIAEIRNADRAAVRSVLGFDPAESADHPDAQAMLPLIRTLLPDALVTAYTFLPTVGITSITDHAGKTSYFDYDFNNRLVQIRDLEGSAVTQYIYSTFSGGISGPSPAVK